jgi:hypothetical protein
MPTGQRHPRPARENPAAGFLLPKEEPEAMSQVADLGADQRAMVQELGADCPLLAVSIPRAAEITDLSPTELYSEMKSGRLPFVKHGRRRLLMIDDLKALLMSQRHAA